MPQGFIAEHVSQRPAGIDNGFCHPRLCQTRSIYVTSDATAMLCGRRAVSPPQPQAQRLLLFGSMPSSSAPPPRHARQRLWRGEFR